MGYNIQITKPLNKNDVQVEISSKKGNTIYYQVPKDKADSFVKNYKKQDKKLSIISNTAFAGSVIAGPLIANIFTRKIPNKFWRFALNTAAGVAAATGTFMFLGDYMNKVQNKFIQEHGAKEIHYMA